MAVLASLVAISIIAAGATSGTSGDPLARDAHSYASDHSTTIEEAKRRILLQDDIGALNRQLAENESATFAGL